MLRYSSVHNLPLQWGHFHASCLQTLSVRCCFAKGIQSKTNVLEWKPSVWVWKWNAALLTGIWFGFKSNCKVGGCIWGQLAGSAGIRNPAALPPGLTSLIQTQGTREGKHRQCRHSTSAVSYQAMNWQVCYLKGDLVLWPSPNDNCVKRAQMLLSDSMFYLGFLRPFSSVTQALVFHVLRNTLTRMFRQTACGKFVILLLLLLLIQVSQIV